MLAENEVWKLERGFWLGGADHFSKHMADRCLMVLPHPVGMLSGSAILKSLEGMPRWQQVECSERLCVVEGTLAIIAYHAEAARQDSVVYKAFCSSTYLKQGEHWKMVQHQQTPIGE